MYQMRLRSAFMMSGRDVLVKRSRLVYLLAPSLVGCTPPAGAILHRPGGGARRNRAFARSSSLHVSIMDEQAVHRAVARMARELVEQNEGPGNLALMGIRRRGVQIGRASCRERV